MKPFVLFIFDSDSRLSRGGMDDYVGSFESLDAAKKEYRRRRSGAIGQIGHIGPDGMKVVAERPSSGWMSGRFVHFRWRKAKS